VARIPRETPRQGHHGRFARVAELFESRKPKEHAVISEIDGVVQLRQRHQGQRKVW